MLLRIEDTDRARFTREANEAILDGLKWLGIDWHEEPISQFANRERHARIAMELLAAGKAYKCFCSSEELEKMRQDAREKGLPPRYDGRCRNRSRQDRDDAVHVIRIKTPENRQITINDAVQGQVVFKTQNLDDFIILRSDGTPTYMLAVVVDDHDMKVSHIIRGDDHLTNTARQIVIYEALGWTIPAMAHLPLIHGPDGAKLSKRHGALGVDAYRRMGYLPEALINYLARLGWSHGDDEFFTTGQLIEWFSLEALNKGAARFDLAKLENLNSQHIRRSRPEGLFESMLSLAGELGQTDDKAGLENNRQAIMEILPELQPRAKTLLELISLAQFIYAPLPIKIEEKAARHINEQTRQMIADIALRLENIKDWTPQDISMAVRKFGDDNSIKLGKIAQPLRVALTGRTVSAGIFEIMAVLGRDESLKRLRDQAANQAATD